MLPRVALALIPLAAAGPAAAHLGHLGEVAGHSHWVAGAAVGLAGVIALWAATRRRRGTRDRGAAPKAAADRGTKETDQA